MARDLRRRFGAVEAVRGVSFEVARGEMFALLGSTGSGKSTILRMLCALTPPSGGRAVVSGYDVAERWRAVRRRVVLVSAGQPLERLPVPDVLFLDDPVDGLLGAVRRLRDPGTTVLFTTSSIADAEQADRIAILDEGRIVALGTPAGLKAAVGTGAGLDAVFIHVTGARIRPTAGDALGAARRFMAARRQDASEPWPRVPSCTR